LVNESGLFKYYTFLIIYRKRIFLEKLNVPKSINTGMLRVTTFRPKTDRMYNDGPIILRYYNII